MTRFRSLLAIGVPVIAAATFVLVTSRSLPTKVASHFGPGGAANGYMWHDTYVHFTLIFVVIMPLMLNLLAGAVARLPEKLVNIPNRRYWLAPERRAQTVDMLRGQMQLFAAMLIAFLCYVHWLVVRANASLPPVLENGRFVAGMGVFMFALIAWIVAMRRKFRPPET